MTSMSAVDRNSVVYPESDGQPMADNQVQFNQMARLYQQLETRFGDREDVCIGGDLLWYPVEGHPEICRAPDIFAVPGRPKLPLRRAWLQWEEDGVAMRHVVEILSPANSGSEMLEKRRFYERYGVEEYLVFDPENGSLEVHVRTDLGLVPLAVELPWRSEVLEGCCYRVDRLMASDHGDGDRSEAGHDLVLLDIEHVKIPTHAEALDAVRTETARAEAEAARADAEAARADELERRLRAAGIDP